MHVGMVLSCENDGLMHACMAPADAASQRQRQWRRPILLCRVPSFLKKNFAVPARGVK